MNLRSLVLHGFRSWQRARGVALLAVAALALGIGSTTTIYTVVQAVLLQPLPYADASRHVTVLGGWRGRPERNAFSYPEARDFAARARTVDAFGCYTSGGYNVTFNRQPVHASGTQVSPAIARSLGVTPRAGRWFTEDDARESSGVRAVVLSTRLWQRFGADPSIVGKTIRMDGTAYAVTGVMPAGFRFPIDEDSDLWTPLYPDPQQRKNRGYRYLICAAKQRADVSLSRMTADLQGILTQFLREHPSDGGSTDIIVTPQLQLAVESIRPTLLLLLGAAGVLLLITCANVASLLLARAVARARETAVRLALGSSLRQLGAQFFLEGLIVAGAGAALGTLASVGMLRLLLSIAADEIPRAELVALDWRVLAVTLVVTAASALLCSVAPLWQARRAPVSDVLSDGARASASARSRGLLRLFVITQLALACGLVAIGAALVQHLAQLRGAALGFDPTNVLSLQIVTPFAGDASSTIMRDRQARLLEAFRAIPGVESVGFGNRLPLAGSTNATKLWIDGEPEPADAASAPLALTFVSPDLFRTLRVPLVQGRFLTDADEESRGVMALVINETAARRYWGGRDPLGARVRISAWGEGRFQIVGIVADTRNIALGEPTRAEIFLSFRHVAPIATRWAVRSTLDRHQLARELRAAAARVDPEQAMFDERPLHDMIGGTLVRQRLQSFVVGFFALSALLLAVLGVYGVVAYSVRQRAPELGTRIALGASARHILTLVIGDGVKMAAIGIALGVAAVLVMLKLPAATSADLQLLSAPGSGFAASGYALSAAPFLSAIALIASFTILACLVPAWHAASISPLVAMRNEPDTLLSRARAGYKRVATRVSGFAARSAERTAERTVGEVALLCGLAASSRGASSFSDAIDSALDTLRERFGAEFALLLVSPGSGDTRGPSARGEESNATRVPRPLRVVSGSPSDASRDWTLPADALILRRLRHLSGALPLTDADLDSWSRWAEAHAPAHLDELRTLHRMRVALATAVPMPSDGAGILLLGPPVARGPFTADERLALPPLAAQLALLVENARLTDRIVEQERLRHELRLAADVQRRLFPESSPDTPALQCGGICLPARGVGGDCYDFLDLGDGKTGLALADVSGKGIAAALIMSVVQASLRSLADANGSAPAALAGTMNRLLHQSTSANSYATFFYARFDATRRELRYVNAGHNPPYIVRRGGTAIEPLTVGGIALGMFPQWDYAEAVVTLEPGDVLVAFTDGVVEAHDVRDEEFGEERLEALLRRTAMLPAPEMMSAMLDELRAWMGDAAQYDDLTFIVARVG